MRKSPEILLNLSVQAYLLLALIVLVIPIGWILSGMLAAVFHELCHYAVILFCSGNITQVRICDNGVVIEAADLQPWQELLGEIAGPIGSFLLVTFIRRFPILGICAFVQGAFNLLPVFPLDGGRAVRTLIEMVHPRDNEQLFRALQATFLVVIGCGAIVISALLNCVLQGMILVCAVGLRFYRSILC